MSVSIVSVLAAFVQNSSREKPSWIRAGYFLLDLHRRRRTLSSKSNRVRTREASLERRTSKKEKTESVSLFYHIERIPRSSIESDEDLKSERTKHQGRRTIGFRRSTPLLRHHRRSQSSTNAPERTRAIDHWIERILRVKESSLDPLSRSFRYALTFLVLPRYSLLLLPICRHAHVVVQ